MHGELAYDFRLLAAIDESNRVQPGFHSAVTRYISRRFFNDRRWRNQAPQIPSPAAEA